MFEFSDSSSKSPIKGAPLATLGNTEEVIDRFEKRMLKRKGILPVEEEVEQIFNTDKMTEYIHKGGTKAEDRVAKYKEEITEGIKAVEESRRGTTGKNRIELPDNGKIDRKQFAIDYSVDKGMAFRLAEGLGMNQEDANSWRANYQEQRKQFETGKSEKLKVDPAEVEVSGSGDGNLNIFSDVTTSPDSRKKGFAEGLTAADDYQGDQEGSVLVEKVEELAIKTSWLQGRFEAIQAKIPAGIVVAFHERMRKKMQRKIPTELIMDLQEKTRKNMELQQKNSIPSVLEEDLFKFYERKGLKEEKETLLETRKENLNLVKVRRSQRLEKNAPGSETTEREGHTKGT